MPTPRKPETLQAQGIPPKDPNCQTSIDTRVIAIAVAKSNSSSNSNSKSAGNSNGKLKEFEYYSSAKILSRVNC